MRNDKKFADIEMYRSMILSRIDDELYEIKHDDACDYFLEYLDGECDCSKKELVGAIGRILAVVE